MKGSKDYRKYSRKCIGGSLLKYNAPQFFWIARVADINYPIDAELKLINKA